MERVKQRVLDIASDSVTDALFGKRGSSGGGLLSGLLGGLLGGGASGGSGTSEATLLDFIKSGPTGPFGYADGGVVGMSMPPGGVCGQAQGCGELPA